MDLKQIIADIQRRRLSDSNDALKGMASSEKYFRDAYESRYLFELIQNVRDANKSANTRGAVYIELSEASIIVSNTGAPFNERGVNSITTIGDSPKDSQEFIGFKGIGFKSIQEVTDTPYIVTDFGTIKFDRDLTLPLLADRKMKRHEFPLFFIPHYFEEKLSDSERGREIVTKIVLPLKGKVNIEEIEERFDEIGIHKILLLGSLATIQLKTPQSVHRYTIDENPTTRIVTIQKNDEVYRFRHYKPQTKIAVPESVINLLEDKERELYEKEPYVDISLVFDLDEKGRLSPNNGSKLYLFYPTDITSGFSFIIHSYFLVSPDRKTLRDNSLNRFILESIADFLSGEWLSNAKKTNRSSFLDFLAFTRNAEAPILNSLYNRLVENLKREKILYDNVSQRFYRVNEVIIADGFDKGLFPDNILNGMRLIYVGNSDTRDWLKREFNVEYLEYETIQRNIEKECEKQKVKRNFSFFENLYRYASQHESFNIKDKKVFLTSRMSLVSSEDYVFYGYKEQTTLPTTIQNKINFLHPTIKVPDHRQAKGQTGLVEYSTELLVQKLLRMFEDEKVPKIDILLTLIKLNISEKTIVDTKLRQKVLLPIQGKAKWVKPFSNPVYLETDELRLIYPQEKFIDLTLFEGAGVDKKDLSQKLKQFGVWTIPAVYYSEGQSNFNKRDFRHSYINTYIRKYNTDVFYLRGDWLFDAPQSITLWFTTEVVRNWKHYIDIIENTSNPDISYSSQTSYWYTLPVHHLKHLTSFVKYLREAAWIMIEDKADPLKVTDVVGIDRIEAIQPHTAILKKYLNTIPLHYASNKPFIQLLNLCHLDCDTILDFRNILSLIQRKYPAPSYSSEIIAFYNKILNKLYDLYSQNNRIDVSILSYSLLMAVNDRTQKIEWKNGNQIYHIEDKPAYDLLPDKIKSLVQPQFTTRDKNRFGQIAKRIGLDFKKTIVQKLVNINVVRRHRLWEWCPLLAQCLAFAEVILETNLDGRLKQIRDIELIVTQTAEIELYQKNQLIETLENVDYFIIAGSSVQVYVREIPSLSEIALFSNVIHDLLVEILGRDLHKLRVQLNDFLGQRDKVNYLTNYEVSLDRIEEIHSKLEGVALSKKQLFLMQVMNYKTVADPTSFLMDGDVDFARLARVLNIPQETFSDCCEKISYDNFSLIENIVPFGKLFELLDIKLDEFNRISGYRIDFSDHYRNLINGQNLKYRHSFEQKLHQALSGKSIIEKSKFQNKLDEYDYLQISFPSPALMINGWQLFKKAVSEKFAVTLLQNEANVDDQKVLVKLHNKNLAKFRKRIEKNDPNVVNDFFEINANRSLLYFDDTMDELVQRFAAYLKTKEPQPANSPTPTGSRYDAYTNLPGTAVVNVTTENVGTYSPSVTDRSNSSGHRFDGSKSNPTQEDVGVVAEKIVFEKLSEEYNSIFWVSKNAANAEQNPEGSDIHGYDISYVDEEGRKHYVEVKGKMDDQKHFYISYPEYLKAIREKEYYHLYLVLNTLNNAQRKILHLGNIFIQNDTPEELFRNSKFTANFSNLEIRFK